jgi:hypothetical protein
MLYPIELAALPRLTILTQRDGVVNRCGVTATEPLFPVRHGTQLRIEWVRLRSAGDRAMIALQNGG